MTTAAAIIIGDEILTGKIRDENAPLLVDMLRQVGVPLCRMVIIGDEPTSIAEEVLRCSENYDVVITSGGLGPTHDDCTIEGVALAFGVPVVRHPEIEDMIRSYWGSRCNAAALRMADMPEGARLLWAEDRLLPLVVFGNIFMLPGVPQLFAAKLPSLRSELHGKPPARCNLYLSTDETRITALLTQVDAEYAEVKIGSYPRFGEADHRLWISFEGEVEERVKEAAERLVELLPEDAVVRTEPSA